MSKDDRKIDIIVSNINALINTLKIQESREELNYVLKLISNYLKDNKIFIITASDSADIIIEYLSKNIKSSKIKNLILSTETMDKIELNRYNISSLTVFGYNSSDISTILKFPKNGFNAYMVDSINMKNCELFSLIMRMIDIKYFKRISYYFDKNDKENYRRVRKIANDEALEIFCKYIKGYIREDDLYKEIYFYIMCDIYNFKKILRGLKEDNLDPNKLKDKVQLLYSPKDVYEVIKKLS